MFKVVTPLSSHWHHFWWEICCHFCLYSLVCNASFALAAFNIFYLSLDSNDMLVFSSCFLCFGILVVLGFVFVIFISSGNFFSCYICNYPPLQVGDFNYMRFKPLGVVHHSLMLFNFLFIFKLLFIILDKLYWSLNALFFYPVMSQLLLSPSSSRFMSDYVVS